ncbi:MAG: hypothetical protein DMG93_12235 [Acidobacteria bacterium]|nr:MAG: hypothetical protein DMG93_12235 [Acidobacteriota bacterium]
MNRHQAIGAFAQAGGASLLASTSSLASTLAPMIDAWPCLGCSRAGGVERVADIASREDLAD